MKIILLTLILVFSQSCSNTEKKKPLNYLNGENYAVTNLAEPTPLLYGIQSKERLTVLNGTAVITQGATRIPLKMVKIVLYQNDKIFGESTTGLDGNFEMKKPLKNGSYILKIDSPKYAGALHFQIVDYKNDNLVIVATPK